jgi:hypothetical protein
LRLTPTSTISWSLILGSRWSPGPVRRRVSSGFIQDRRREAVKRAEELQRVAAFVQRRDALIAPLSPEHRECYKRLAAVCQDIKTASTHNLLASADPATDPRLRKLDELMWT